MVEVGPTNERPTVAVGMREGRGQRLAACQPHPLAAANVRRTTHDGRAESVDPQREGHATVKNHDEWYRGKGGSAGDANMCLAANTATPTRARPPAPELAEAARML